MSLLGGLAAHSAAVRVALPGPSPHPLPEGAAQMWPVPAGALGRLMWRVLMRPWLGRGGRFLTWGRAVPQDCAHLGAYATRRPVPPPRPPELLPAAPTADLPEAYIFSLWPETAAGVTLLAETWGWAGATLGADLPLVVIGAPADARLPADLHFPDVVARPLLPWPELLAAVQAAQIVLDVAGNALWEGPTRWALALGKPLAARLTPVSDAICGPAAYLIGDHPVHLGRGLGAALITLAVETDLADTLARGGRERAASWSSAALAESLLPRRPA
jgi:hypothetical protein